MELELEQQRDHQADEVPGRREEHVPKQLPDQREPGGDDTMNLCF